MKLGHPYLLNDKFKTLESFRAHQTKPPFEVDLNFMCLGQCKLCRHCHVNHKTEYCRGQVSKWHLLMLLRSYDCSMQPKLNPPEDIRKHQRPKSLEQL